MPRSGAAVASLTALVLLAGGCGGEKSAAERQQCVLEARAEAKTEVVSDFYERGELGTREEIERSLGGRPSFFDEEGHILPRDEMTPQQQLSFDKWILTPRVVEVTRAAQQDALRDLDPDC